MLHKKSIWSALLLLMLISLLTGCGDSSSAPAATVTTAFESGSIGKSVKVSATEWELTIADDNNDPSLPATWRSWWYIRLDNAVTDTPTTFTLKNSGWTYYYLPIYSYDQKTWHRFEESEVTQNQNSELVVRKQFAQPTVWIARFYPYTFTDLETYLRNIAGNRFLEIQIPGYSQNGRPIYLLKLTDPNSPVAIKKRVFIHARTHPAETSPSFLLEGLINSLLSGSSAAASLLATTEFYIFPMHNVDGVIAGNYRSTPKSENLEVMWYQDISNPINLRSDVPQEISVIHQYAKRLMTDGGPPVGIALNLHASNSEPDIRTFFYPHFGTAAQGYTAPQAALWDRQIRFINLLAARYSVDLLEPAPENGGSGFANSPFPESWWWVNFQDTVMAMTIEMTYGRAGFAPRWITPDDTRQLGTALLWSIGDYCSGATAAKSARTVTGNNTGRQLLYPAWYPPNAADEQKY
ncbi:MAG: M14-type cytosolic carboxypeptidase [Geobacter sp.]|nr:M14-type cytosolic carboxypeptidase [Geobacter sp.]